MTSNSSNDSSGLNNVTSLFQRKEIIGRGKFGVVYKAYRVKTQQVYAIKVLNLDNPEDEVEDIQKEIQFLSSLKQTPNITHYYGSYLNGTKLWVIMEYCAGGSLRTLLRPGIIEERYIGVIMREILAALISIHKDNVIHRDIKAANVLIANNGNVKLCDFGVAAQLSQSMLKRQTMAGTPYWMAPEVIMEGVYYDTRVDIWSLGITAYEIATGNPPYCHMEAIRAMQMITKSKPPRLEGREYSQPLKEFIALCLDEDPKERPSAEELFKSKLIRQEKGTSTSILRELITRYLLFREKNEQSKHEDESNMLQKEDTNSSIDGSELSNDNSLTDKDSDDIDIKWDFDSLSSKEYILENDINVDAIPEESDWIKYSHQEVNYAYPEEEYYNSNKPYFPYYQGSTIGKTFGNPATNFSTIQAVNNVPTNQHNSHFTKHYQNTGTGTTGTTGTTANHLSRHTGTGTATHGTTKRNETKASKQLLQLFEETPEDVYDFPKLNKTMSSYSVQPSGGSLHAEMDNDMRPDMRGMHSQSTPALSLLQTNFKSNIGGPGSSSVLPTPIEIEIPEELPVSKESVLTINTKPRSSTVSSMSQKTTPVLQRRPTISGPASAQLSSLRSEGLAGINNTKLVGVEDANFSHNFLSSNINNNAYLPSKPVTNAVHARSPSPSRALAGISPEKKSLDPSHQAQTSTLYNNTPPVMKQLQSTNDILLQSMNSPSESKEPEETSRINRDFKKQHPHLKLQMPSPTTLVGSSKLLDSTHPGSHTDDTQSQQPNQQNVNQFGINTSNAQISVAMTPVGEKRMGDLIKTRKRSTSTSTSTSMSASTSLSASASINGNANGTISSSSRNNSITTEHVTSGSQSQPQVTQSQSQNSIATNMNGSTLATSNGTPSSSIPAANTPPNLPSGLTFATALTLMEPPPKSLSLDMFIDVHDDTLVDKKQTVLTELDSLLKMFEDGLSAIEHTLRNSLPQESPED